MCFVLWLLFFGGRCGHLLLLLSSIICFSSAEGMVSSSSEHILGLCICICICVWRYWWWCVTSALQLIRAHSWLPSLRRMLLTPRGFPRLVSRWYVTHQIKPTSHPIQLSNYPTIQVVQLYKPRTRYVTHQIKPTSHPIQLYNYTSCTTIQATDQICHSPYPTYPTSHISSLTRSLYNYKYKYYRWGCLLGRLRSCTPSTCLSRGVLGHGGGVLELNAMLTSREASTPKG